MVVQLLILLTALFLVRKKRIFPILFIPFLTTTFFTLLVQFTANTTLALMFPWRVTAILVPISTVIITTFVLDHLWHIHLKTWTQTHAQATRIGLSTILLVLVAIGITRFTIEANQKYNTAEREMQNWVKQNHQSGDLYLVPIKMQDFRLATGVPILADFKSIPTTKQTSSNGALACSTPATSTNPLSSNPMDAISPATSKPATPSPTSSFLSNSPTTSVPAGTKSPSTKTTASTSSRSGNQNLHSLLQLSNEITQIL